MPFGWETEGLEKYAEGNPYSIEYFEGRAARINDLDLEDNPYRHQPHDANKSTAWVTGWKDEDDWSLYSTGR